MATDRDFIDYVLEQAGLGSGFAYRKMFGEYGFYLDGKFVAVAADNRLFLKPTMAGRALLPTVTEAAPYPGAKAWLVIDEYLDDNDLLPRLLRTTADALPMPKPKPAKKVGKGRDV